VKFTDIFWRNGLISTRQMFKIRAALGTEFW
jgi:hypothetical protein